MQNGGTAGNLPPLPFTAGAVAELLDEGLVEIQVGIEAAGECDFLQGHVGVAYLPHRPEQAVLVVETVYAGIEFPAEARLEGMLGDSKFPR